VQKMVCPTKESSFDFEEFRKEMLEAVASKAERVEPTKCPFDYDGFRVAMLDSITECVNTQVSACMGDCSKHMCEDQNKFISSVKDEQLKLEAVKKDVASEVKKMNNISLIRVLSSKRVLISINSLNDDNMSVKVCETIKKIMPFTSKKLDECMKRHGYALDSQTTCVFKEYFRTKELSGKIQNEVVYDAIYRRLL